MVTPLDPSERFQTLDPPTRLVAGCLSLLHPRDVSPTEIARLFAAADLRISGKRLTQKDCKHATDELLREGLAYRPRPNAGVALRLRAVLPLARLTDPKLLTALWWAYGHRRHTYHLYDVEYAEAAVRRALLTGDLRDFEQFTHPPDSVWRVLAYDTTGELIDRVPETHRERAMSAALAAGIGQFAACEPLLAACMATDADQRRYAGDVAFVRVLQGRFDEAMAVFADMPPKRRAHKACAVGEAATRALLAAIRGDDPGLLEGIEAACAAEKAGTRKRYVFPASRAFAVAAAALVRQPVPEVAALLDRIVRAGERNTRKTPLSAFTRDAHEARAGALRGQAETRTDLEFLLFCIRQCWPESEYGPSIGQAVPALQGMLARAESEGYLWVAAECASVIARVADEDVAEAARARARKWHSALGTVSLTDLLQPIEPWEQAMQGLERLAFDASQKAGVKKREPAAQSDRQRLAWILTEEWGHVGVTPKLQKSNRSGGWTRGQPVSARRLLTDAESTDGLLEADLAVIATGRRDARSRSGFYFDDAALYHLVGHPHVFDEKGAPVKMVRGEPELIVEPTDDGLIARLVPYGDGERPYHVEFADGTCRVTRFGPSHARLRDLVPQQGLALPEAVRGRLTAAIAALASEIRVQSNIDGEESVSAREGDPLPWVRLVPEGEGLTLTLHVEPLPGSGVYFTPGHGGTRVYAPDAEGAVVAISRDLAAEQSALAGLLAACPRIPPAHSPSEPLTLTHPGDCLDLLEQLQVADARCVWPSGETLRIVGRADASNFHIAVRSAGDWFAASGELALDTDTVVDLKRLLEMLDETEPGSRFLKLDAGRFLALTDAFRRELEELRSYSRSSRGRTVQLHPLAADVLDEAGTEIDGDKAWREQCRRFREARSLQPVVPTTLQAELRQYQTEGFTWLARLGQTGAGACLADDMGLGKTVQALALLLFRGTGGPALVVAPTSVTGNWAREAARFAPTLNVVPYSGGPASRQRLLEGLGAQDVVVTTYGLLQNDIEQLSGIHWHSAILDEAQAVKNISTKRAGAILKLEVDFRLATTGTPIQNNLMDLYALFRFLNPGMLGSAAEFHRRYALPIERNGDPEVRSRLNRLIAPFMLRRLKAEVLDDLPPRTEITLEVVLSREEAALYEALRQRALDDLHSGAAPVERRRIEVFAHLTRLRLACCNPALVSPGKAPPSSKLAAFAETLDEILGNRHKVLVFSQFVKHLTLIRAYLDEAGIAYHYLDGSTPAKARNQRIEAFQAGDRDVFLISLKAGGTGLNLTAADYVIHLDPWWNPAVEDQASDRAHRLGQTRPVTIYRLVTLDTIEERIVDLHKHKRELADQLLEGTDTPAALDAAELMALLEE